MVRSMYSGVSGLRSHQTRMDTIGNNIANVNTYGFKSGRTTFRDIYYQTMSSASSPTAAMGGMNPSQVGYGAQVGSVDLMMSRSTFSMTDQTMDLAIDGEGFFQVQDGAGNTFYTRAGMMNFDAAGNLVDMQGNYVLGINGDPSGRTPGSERIAVALPPVSPTGASVVQTINGEEYTIAASNATTDGNMNFNFATKPGIPDGQVIAELTTTGITVFFNEGNTYADWGELNTAINNAITAANNGEPHAAGTFTISYTGTGTDPMANGITAKELCSVDYNIQKTVPSFGTGNTFFGGMYPSSVGNTFSGDGAIQTMDAQYVAAVGNDPAKWVVTMDVNGVNYVGEIDANKTSNGEFYLYNSTNSDTNDFISMKRPSFNNITAAWGREQGYAPATTANYSIGGAAVNNGDTLTFDFGGGNVATVNVDATMAGDPDALSTAIAAAINTLGLDYTATATTDGTGNVALVSNTPGATTKPTVGGYGGTITGPDGTAAGTVLPQPVDGDSFAQVNAGQMGNPVAVPSAPSRNMGFSGSAFALRGGTAGGSQTIADMTGIQISPNGVITGWDSVGTEIIIGRIDIVTFANPSGLNQAGSSNYTESPNSGTPVLNQPGSGGAGKLVGGTLELSNVDLSREFSDMITTQRGYQANSRIITVSDTMLEELINLKR